KFLGAAYLIYLGVRRLLTQPRTSTASGAAGRLPRAFLDGVIVNVLNPKTALFFLAFLPPFAGLSRGALRAQILGLGLLFMPLGIVTDGLYALSAGTAAEWLRGRPHFLASERWVSGGMYIGLGIAAALTGSHRK